MCSEPDILLPPPANDNGDFDPFHAVLLVRNGAFCEAAMKRERITKDEAMSAVRSAGGQGIDEVESLILESDGTPSTVLKR